MYTAQDGNTTINWIKFYLGGTYSISRVVIINRLDTNTCCGGRLENTAVYVYTSKPEAEVAHCGTIIGVNRDSTAVEDQTYNLDCGGENGDMIYVTDLDAGSNEALNFAEIEVYGNLGIHAPIKLH